MPRSRRHFLKYVAVGTGSALTGAGWWAAKSKQRAARWVRRLVADARRNILPAPFKPDPAHWSDNQVTLAWLGHTTVLINFYGVRILTDPALGNRVGISLGVGIAGPKRYIAPALRPQELPPIDVLLLSHAHMDHMDLPTLRCFGPNTFTVTARTTQDLLQATRLKRITELSWNERVTFSGPKGELEMQGVEVKHWGARWPSEQPRGYNGYILRREGRTLLFAGDTALTPALGQIRSKGPFDLAVMPIGAYRPWIWNHCTPEQAVEMANKAGAQYILPVHHQTFQLSDEPMSEPMERLEAALHHEPERLALRRVGGTFVCPNG
jgi:L-ascorbate metabolism protein UlaG (beta-lactamase superfamily)